VRALGRQLPVQVGECFEGTVRFSVRGCCLPPRGRLRRAGRAGQPGAGRSYCCRHRCCAAAGGAWRGRRRGQAWCPEARWHLPPMARHMPAAPLTRASLPPAHVSKPPSLPAQPCVVLSRPSTWGPPGVRWRPAGSWRCCRLRRSPEAGGPLWLRSGREKKGGARQDTACERPGRRGKVGMGARRGRRRC
jgi:hypothetical protein